jgi:hypothetical protein
MSRHLLEDMVKIREIKPVKVVKEKKISIIENTQPKSKSRYFLWFTALLSFIFCLFALSFLFAKAEITINPKIINTVLNENLSAVKDADADQGLFFNLVAIPGDETKNIQVTGQKEVSKTATGTIVIYNSFSSTPQLLSINSRLQGSNGKIYETDTKIIVPGLDKNGAPGTVEVGIHASAPGAEYNSNPLDFTIIGFKGTAKYLKFKGRSETGTTISGGFAGEAPDLSDADLASAESDMETSLQTELLQKVTDQIPDGFILFKNAILLSADNADNQPNISSTFNPDNSVTLKLSGTLYGILFNEQNLTQKIAEDNIENYDSSDVYIPNIKNLIFSLTTPETDVSNLANLSNINFSLTGSAQIVSKVDTNKFTTDILGRPKKDFSQILSQYQSIDSATLKLNFPWIQSIPNNIKRVKLTVNYPS